MTPSEKLRQMEPCTEIDLVSPRIETMQRIEGGKPILVPYDYWRASVEFHQSTDLGVAVTTKEYVRENFDDLVEVIWQDYQKFIEA